MCDSEVVATACAVALLEITFSTSEAVVIARYPRTSLQLNELKHYTTHLLQHSIQHSIQQSIQHCTSQGIGSNYIRYIIRHLIIDDAMCDFEVVPTTDSGAY